MMLGEITPLILTYNERSNIHRTLEHLDWASQIVIVDSESDDETLDLASKFSNVRIIKRRFDDHTAQWNFGLDQIETQWVLTLDADYICPAELAAELQALPDKDVVYLVHFHYCIMGKALRGTLYPPRTVLFNPRRSRYVQDGHTQRLDTGAQAVFRLETRLLHDDRKPLSDWYAAQVRYAQLEATKLVATPSNQLSWKDRVRRWYVVAPVLTFIYCLVVKRLIFDGRAGWYYTMQRAYAEWLLGMTLLDHKLRSKSQAREQGGREPTLAARLPEDASGHQQAAISNNK